MAYSGCAGGRLPQVDLALSSLPCIHDWSCHPAAASAPPQVLDGIVRQVEMDEVRAIGLEHKARLKAEKQAERDRRRADKER